MAHRTKADPWRRAPWKARVRHQGVMVALSYHATPEEAVAAEKKVRDRLVAEGHDLNRRRTCWCDPRSLLGD